MVTTLLQTAWVTASALTQLLAQTNATEVQAAPEFNRWLAVVIGLLLTVGVAVASCMNPLRGHRD